MREIEILVEVLEPKEKALKKLSPFKKHHITKIVDKYYYSPWHKHLLPDTANTSEMLRIRSKDDKNYITFKKDIFSGKKWLYSDEYETEIKDAKVLSDIFEHLQFKPLVTVHNTRHVYYYKDFEICLEDVKNLGLFLEVECITPGRKNPNQVRADIFALVKKIGIKVSDEVQMGKAELLYRKLKKR